MKKLMNQAENFTYIPCLNDRQDWIDVLVKWLKGWQNN